MAARHAMWAVCAPGVERVACNELKRLGVEAVSARGGVEAWGSRWDMWRILHQVRTVDQVRVRIGSVRARAFWELERGLRRLDFAPFLPNSNGVIRTSAASCALFHTDAVSERVRRHLKSHLPLHDVRADAPAVHVHGERDTFTVSIDASGPAPLHRRGGKARVGTAPLKETLAAAVLSAVCEAEGLWDGVEGFAGDGDSKAISDMLAPTPRPFELLDPMCGSGTFLSEAAGLLLGLPSLWPLALQPEGAGALSLGALRGRLSCEAWPDHSGKQYATFLKRLYAPLKRPERYARASAWRGLDLRLHGSDCSGQAVANARANWAGSGLDALLARAAIRMGTEHPPVTAAIDRLAAPAAVRAWSQAARNGRGEAVPRFVVANLPYGTRLPVEAAPSTPGGHSWKQAVDASAAALRSGAACRAYLIATQDGADAVTRLLRRAGLTASVVMGFDHGGIRCVLIQGASS